MQISISKTLQEKLPFCQLVCLQADVKVENSSPSLLEEIAIKTKTLEQDLVIDAITSLPAIHATREAYKTLGKKPSRYRPSAEALLRRTLQGKGLYQVNNVVDLLNLVSISTGYSIGGYDVSKIEGDIEWSIGATDEPYQAIGRGALNIEFLPLFRDQKGAFGSPTSDSVRTSVTADTTNFLMTFFVFHQDDEAIKKALELSTTLLEKYAKSQTIKTWVVNV